MARWNPEDTCQAMSLSLPASWDDSAEPTVPETEIQPIDAQHHVEGPVSRSTGGWTGVVAGGVALGFVVALALRVITGGPGALGAAAEASRAALIGTPEPESVQLVQERPAAKAVADDGAAASVAQAAATKTAPSEFDEAKAPEPRVDAESRADAAPRADKKRRSLRKRRRRARRASNGIHKRSRQRVDIYEP
jgi:hypothetical protein